MRIVLLVGFGLLTKEDVGRVLVKRERGLGNGLEVWVLLAMYLLSTASVTHNAYLFDSCGLELHVFIAVVFVSKFVRDVRELRGHVLLVVEWFHHWFWQRMRSYFRLGIQVVGYNKVRRWLLERLELVRWLLASQVGLILF